MRQSLPLSLQPVMLRSAIMTAVSFVSNVHVVILERMLMTSGIMHAIGPHRVLVVVMVDAGVLAVEEEFIVVTMTARDVLAMMLLMTGGTTRGI